MRSSQFDPEASLAGIVAARIDRERRFRETFRMWSAAAPPRIAQAAPMLTPEQLAGFQRLLTPDGYKDLYEFIVENYAKSGTELQAQAEAFMGAGKRLQSKTGLDNRARVEAAAKTLQAGRSRSYTSINELAKEIEKMTSLSNSTVRAHLKDLSIAR